MTDIQEAQKQLNAIPGRPWRYNLATEVPKILEDAKKGQDQECFRSTMGNFMIGPSCTSTLVAELPDCPDWFKEEVLERLLFLRNGAEDHWDSSFGNQPQYVIDKAMALPYKAGTTDAS